MSDATQCHPINVRAWLPSIGSKRLTTKKDTASFDMRSLFLIIEPASLSTAALFKFFFLFSFFFLTISY